jgi:hypothetical protein
MAKAMAMDLFLFLKEKIYDKFKIYGNKKSINLQISNKLLFT